MMHPPQKHVRLPCFAAIIFSLLAVTYCKSTRGGIVPANDTVPAIIVFGDSIVDPGNNNYIKTIIKCNFPPYGRDFEGGLPTGRFCNGKVPSDYIAQAFGVKDLLPAYLDSNLKIQDLLTGVSFASGGAGYDPLTPQIVSVLSLADQLELFKEYTSKIRSAIGEEKSQMILSKSVFIICAGSDDIANTYFSTPFRSAHYDINSYTDLIASEASKFVQQLYDLGARRIGVLGAPPIGCVPSQRTLGGGATRGCSEAQNDAAKLFNSKLSKELKSLKEKLPGSRPVYFDIYYPLNSLVQNPANYGFQVSSRGCCGTGNIEVSILCNKFEDNKTCSDASKYVFWDSYHPSEKAYEILTPMVIKESVNQLF